MRRSLRANPHAHEFGQFGGLRKANSAGALAAENMGVDFCAEVFEHGLDGSRNDLAQAADGSEGHGLGEFFDEREIGAIGGFGEIPLGPAGE